MNSKDMKIGDIGIILTDGPEEPTTPNGHYINCKVLKTPKGLVLVDTIGGQGDILSVGYFLERDYEVKLNGGINNDI